ncbi:NAD-dependent epimerase/dehydratase [Methylocaldum marinum]|uniref:GDP-L-fucose synthase n=1 Tax=Methylocaldum marinum TaxID=1432792 RepID=A0A250KP77_9GAMM|nr:GDP-L-fucose synthase [Methylocaldum marinum]BBA33354.1 NAD-dependent epimerase/dehydratase [Methylocaldum marinum]
MDKQDKIYVAGHTGLVGSAIYRNLKARGYNNIVTRSHTELDLTNQAAVQAFFEGERPDCVLLCAAKVGGILANSTYPAQFIYENLAIQTNVVHAAMQVGVSRLLFLGSSCIYPRDCPQPIREDYLLSGPLELTNRPYAIAKIAGIEMCWAYNREYGTRYLAVMPTNLYGPGDNYDLETSHVLPALIRKMHEAKDADDGEVVVWGKGTPRREFLYSDDLADAVLHLMTLPDDQFSAICASLDHPPLINIGCGEDLSIRELAELIREIVGFKGKIVWDATKPDGTPRKLLDVTRLSELGWRATTSLQEAPHYPQVS